MLYQVIIIFHVLLGVGIVALVLMQHGKGADAGAAFGSGSSGTVFGAQGSASFLSRTTAIFAALFFTTSLGLAVLSGYSGKKTDLIETISVEESKTASDVPSLNSSQPSNKVAVPATSDAVAVEKLPEAPVIKEVERAPAPAAKP
jgi:preprotein translocase subunit SecG